MKSELVSAEFLRDTEEIELCAVQLAYALRCMVTDDPHTMAVRNAALAKWDALMNRVQQNIIEEVRSRGQR